jgi:hypothetical protein
LTNSFGFTKAVPGLGVASARAIEAFFAAWPALTEKARALVVTRQRNDIVPWEAIRLPYEVDGSAGTFRAPRATCTLDATSDYQAVQTWLALHESPATVVQDKTVNLSKIRLSIDLMATIPSDKNIIKSID